MEINIDKIQENYSKLGFFRSLGLVFILVIGYWGYSNIDRVKIPDFTNEVTKIEFSDIPTINRDCSLLREKSGAESIGFYCLQPKGIKTFLEIVSSSSGTYFQIPTTLNRIEIYDHTKTIQMLRETGYHTETQVSKGPNGALLSAYNMYSSTIVPLRNSEGLIKGEVVYYFKERSKVNTTDLIRMSQILANYIKQENDN